MSSKESFKIVAIGDIHGRDIWRRILDKEIKSTDTIVFMGDYFDSFNINVEDQIENFKAILNLKITSPDNIKLLIGNHDFHYMKMGEKYSGFSETDHDRIEELVASAKDLLQMSYYAGGYLFTHAGVSQTWATNNGIDVHVEDSINKLFRTHPESFKYVMKDLSGYGDHIGQSPIWIRPRALVKDPLEPFIHVVGHTHRQNIEYYEGEDPARLILTDALDSGEYLTITEDGPSTSNIWEQ